MTHLGVGQLALCFGGRHWGGVTSHVPHCRGHRRAATERHTGYCGVSVYIDIGCKIAPDFSSQQRIPRPIRPSPQTDIPLCALCICKAHNSEQNGSEGGGGVRAGAGAAGGMWDGARPGGRVHEAARAGNRHTQRRCSRHPCQPPPRARLVGGWGCLAPQAPCLRGRWCRCRQRASSHQEAARTDPGSALASAQWVSSHFDYLISSKPRIFVTVGQHPHLGQNIRPGIICPPQVMGTAGKNGKPQSLPQQQHVVPVSAQISVPGKTKYCGGCGQMGVVGRVREGANPSGRCARPDPAATRRSPQPSAHAAADSNMAQARPARAPPKRTSLYAPSGPKQNERQGRASAFRSP